QPHLPDARRLHAAAPPIPPALTGRCRRGDLRRLPVDGLVLPAPDDDRPAEARAGSRRGAAPRRTDRPRERPRADRQAEERYARPRVVRLRPARPYRYPNDPIIR